MAHALQAGEFITGFDGHPSQFREIANIKEAQPPQLTTYVISMILEELDNVEYMRTWQCCQAVMYDRKSSYLCQIVTDKSIMLEERRLVDR